MARSGRPGPRVARDATARLEVVRVTELHRTPAGDPARALVRPRVRASWARSQRYGVSPEAVEPVFSGALPTDSLFYQCGAEVLGRLHDTLVDEPVGLMITDAEGLVLARWSDDRDINRSLDRVHLAPGFYFGERTAGTN